MKRIPFELFGPGQYLCFDIGRLIQAENLTGKSAGEIIQSQTLNLGLTTALLSVGLRQHGIHSPQWYAERMQELISDGHEPEEFTLPLVKAIAGSGILGRAVYYAVFPEEAPPDEEKNPPGRRTEEPRPSPNG